MKNQTMDFPESTSVLWTNSVGRSGTGAAAEIAAGRVLRMGARGMFAVAVVTIAAAAAGAVRTRGTFLLPKATGVAYAVGQRVGYDFANDRVTVSLADGACGVVRRAAASADTSVEVEINETGPRVFEKVLTPTAGEDTANSMDVDVGFPVAGAFVQVQIVNSSNVPRLAGTIVRNPGGSAPTTVRVTETNLAATDAVYLRVVEQASA